MVIITLIYTNYTNEEMQLTHEFGELHELVRLKGIINYTTTF